MSAASSAPTASLVSANAASPGTENSTADKTSSGLHHALFSGDIMSRSEKFEGSEGHKSIVGKFVRINLFVMTGTSCD